MNKQTLKNFGLSLVLAIFLALSSQITVPLLFVPITCQTLAIGLIATMFGKSRSLCFSFQSLVKRWRLD